VALAINEEKVGEVTVLGLVGRLDTDTSADLELAVQDLMQAGVRQFLVDLSGVGYVSSAGLRVLLSLGKTVENSGGLRLAGLNPTVRQVFDVAGFTQLFAIFASRDAALAGKTRTAPRKEPAPAAAAAATAASTVAGLLGVGNADIRAGKFDASLASRIAGLVGAGQGRA
jgi:anti-anti-sigma factor